MSTARRLTGVTALAALSLAVLGYLWPGTDAAAGAGSTVVAPVAGAHTAPAAPIAASPVPVSDPQPARPAARDELVVRVSGGEEGETPLPGARILVLPFHPEPDEAPLHARLEATADHGGQVRVSGLLPAERVPAWITATGHLPRVIVLQAGRVEEVTLSAAAAFHGRLEDAHGAPWPTSVAARIEAESGSFPAWAAGSATPGRPLLLDTMPLGAEPRLWLFAPGRAPDVFATGALRPGRCERSLALPDAATLTLLITDAHDQRPIPDATVSAGPDLPIARSSADGRCVLRAGLGRTHQLVFAASGYTPVRWSRLVGIGDQALVFPIQLRRGARITGLVRDRRGDPIGGARITVERLRLSQHLATLRHNEALPRLPPLAPATQIVADRDPVTATDAAGRFVLDGLGSQDGVLQVRLHARQPGFAPQSSAELDLDVPPRELPMVLTLARAASILGTVSEEGAPVLATVSGTNGATGDIAQTLADGSYCLTGLQPGTVKLLAQRLDRPVVRTEVRLSVDEGATGSCNIDLPALWGVIAGRVFTSLGAPLAGLRIVVSPEPGTRDRRPRSLVSGEDGRWSVEVPWDATARYHVKARYSWFTRHRSGVSGNDALVDFGFPDLAWVEIVARDAATGDEIRDGVRVRVATSGMQSGDGRWLRPERRFVAGAPSAFPQIETPIGPATFVVDGGAAGYLTAQVREQVQAQGTRVVALLARAATVRLRAGEGLVPRRDWNLRLVRASTVERDGELTAWFDADVQLVQGSEPPEPTVFWAVAWRGELVVAGVPPGKWLVRGAAALRFEPETLDVTGTEELTVTVLPAARR